MTMNKEQFIANSKEFLAKMEREWDDYDYGPLTVAEIQDALAGKAKYIDLTKSKNVDSIASYINYLSSLGISEISNEEQFGGEGQGDEYYVIWKIAHPEFGDIYFRHNGSYASHYGHEYYTLDVVEPRQVEVTRYATVK